MGVGGPGGGDLRGHPRNRVTLDQKWAQIEPLNMKWFKTPYKGPEFADLSEIGYSEFKRMRNPRISLKLESV